MTIGQRLRRLREAAGLTQLELAKRARISQPRISQIERDKVAGRLPVRTLTDLAEALGVRLDELIGDDPDYADLELDGLGIPAPETSGLPSSATPLIGREAELAAVCATFIDDGARLVTLTGPGGIGKSLLGLHVVESMRERFACGASVAALAWCNDLAQIVAALAHMLEIRQRDERPLRDRLIETLGSGPRLLYLDNAEHIQQQVAALVIELLRACPDLCILVSSRVPLRIREEHAYPVPPLELPDPYAISLVNAVTASPAVQLFVRRARAVFPHFGVTESNAVELASICRRLDGLPLAIELAAARTKILSLSKIVERLATPLTFLDQGAADLPDRQQGLRATIAWSFELLSPAEQLVFRRLAIFAGGFTFDAAEWLIGDETAPGVDLVNAMECLVDQSLISRRKTMDTAPRFDMLQTIRDFAGDELKDSGEFRAVAGRRLAWCMALAESSEPHLFGPEQRRWLRRLEAERENFVAALEWALRFGEVDAGAKLAIALTDYWYLTGQLSEGRRWLERALDQTTRNPHNSASSFARIRLLASVSQLAQPNGDFGVAAARADESLRLAREIDDLPGIARASVLLGNIAVVRADLVTADAYHQHALELFRRLDDQPWIVAGLNNLALVATTQRDFDRTLTLATEAAHMARAIGDDWGAGIALRMLGDVALARGKIKVAARCFVESLSLGQRNRSRWSIADGLASFGSLALRQGRVERAARFFGSARAIYDAVGLQIPPKLRPDWADVNQAAREALGEEAFAAAWSSGSGLNVEAAVAEALEYGRFARSAESDAPTEATPGT